MKNYLFRFLALFCFLLGISLAYGQSEITGTVKDNTGQGLPGVSVVVKGTSTGTITDLDGKYTLKVSSDATLVFSFIGYLAQEIVVGEQAVIDIALREDAQQLDEVVVLGYAAQTRGDITGSVASVDVAQATSVPLVNAAEALQGRVSGVTVINGGQPGAAPKIVVRGFGTSNGTNPLYIIDGVQTDDPFVLNTINPTDIEQMNVLKDGAAAIYGARASNGVIIITTKSGSYNQTKPIITIDAYTGFSQAVNIPELLNTQQHGEMIFQSLTNDGATPTHPQYGSGVNPVVPTTLQSVPVVANVVPGGTRWLEEITRNAPAQNISVSLQNGGKTGKYYMSVSALNRQGIQLYTDYQRVTTRLNSEFKLSDYVTFGEHLNGTYSDGTNGNQINPALRSSPLIPIRDADGNLAGTYVAAAGLGNSRSPLAQLERGRNNYDRVFRVFGDTYLTANYKGFSFKSTLSGNIEAFNHRRFNALDPEHSEPISTNTLTEQDRLQFSWIWNNVLRYNKDFGNHSIDVLVGTEAISENIKGKELSRTGYLFETPDFYLLSNGSGTPNVNFAFDEQSSLFSVFGTVNYSYKNRYFFTGTLRRDRSSRFLGDNSSDIFPSVSVGWELSEEGFFPQDAFITRVKIKASWGQLGNQTLPSSNPTLNISSLSESLGNYVLNGSAISTGAVLTQVGNPNLRWETSVAQNIGVNLSFFDSKLNFSIEYFNITTEDLFAVDNSLISTTAIDATAPFVNLGNVNNTGFDINISYQNTTNFGLSYGVQANFSTYKNEVTQLISDFQTGNTDFRGGAVTRTEVSRPISSFYGRVVEGVFGSAAEVSSSADQGFTSPADGVGRFKYSDINNDGIINDDDRTFIGSPHPDFTYGVNINLGFKGFDLSIFFSGSQGNDIYNYEKIFSDFPTFFNGNRSVRVLDSWSESNTGGALPALSQTITNSETQPNSYFIEDGSYLRLKNLQFGYTLPNKLTSKIGMETLRFYVQGTNLATFTSYQGFDPEIIPPDNGNDNLTLGVNSNIYPLAQILTLGVNIKF